MTTVTTAPHSAATAQAAPTALSGRRRGVIWGLVVLATVIGIASVLTTWVKRQMLDNDAWNKAATQVIQDPEVRSALSVYLVNQLYENVDVAGALANRLPENLKPLAAPVSAALRQPTTNTVNALLERPRIQQLWIDANTVAHQKLVNVLENKTGSGISTGNGVVTLDLSQLVGELGQELGLPPAALEKLPTGTGQITVMRSDQLSAAQAGVQTVKILSVWLLVLVLGMFGLAIYLAHGIRRETLRNAGWAFVIIGLVVLLVRRLVGNYVLDSLVEAQNRPAVHHVYLIGTAILGQIGYAAILYGAITVFGAVLAGPTKTATSARRWIAPVLNKRPGMVWAACGFVYLLAVLWGGTHALRTWWGILLLGGLLAVGVAAFRRETLREFPSTPTPAT